MKFKAISVSILFAMLLLFVVGCDKSDKTATAPAPESECEDGVCPLPSPEREPDLNNPETRFESGISFTIIIDDDAVKALGGTREEVLAEILEARKSGHYSTVEELINLTITIKGKQVPIKSVIKLQ